MTLDLSSEQRSAMAAVQDWYQNTSGQPVFRLFGYAGSGKTTLARYIVEHLGVDQVRYAAFTGKAASVLRSKGCDPSSTIHSLIYMPKLLSQANVRRLRRELQRLMAARNPDHNRIDTMKAELRYEEERLASPSFNLRTPGESTLTGAGLLVLDECSMVDETMATDLLSFGVPILCLGDPAQLPPVDGDGYLTSAEPDSLLTYPHRSALGSPVTRIATAVRTALTGANHYGIVGLDNGSGWVPDLDRGGLLAADQVLCGTNQTRWQAIRTIRRLKGLTTNGGNGSVPTAGDRIIILTNSGELDIYNGQQFHVLDSSMGSDSERLDMILRDDDGTIVEFPVWRWGFQGPDGERRARLSGRGNVAAATYAHAITVHKAQGSQWPRVLVIDESYVFARMAGGGPDQRFRAGQRWLYTAVTRAADQVVITGTGIIRD